MGIELTNEVTISTLQGARIRIFLKGGYIVAAQDMRGILAYASPFTKAGWWDAKP